MNKSLLLAAIVLGGALPSSWAQTENKTAIPLHGTATASAGTRATAITAEKTLREYGLATPEEAKTLLGQYKEQEEKILAQRQAAYVQMQGRPDDEKRQIWSAMVEAQRTLMAEHRALEKQLSAALKGEREKAAAITTSPAKSVVQPKP